MIDIVLPNELFGVVYYQHHPTYPCSAIAIKTARVVQLPIKHLRIESDGNGALTRALLEDTCLKLCHSLRMRGLMLEDAPVRVATLLLNLTEKFGPVIPETRAVLAELSGLTVETAIRITRSMAAEGILKTRRGSLEILDPVALRKKAGENGLSHEHLEHSSNGRGETA